MVGASFLFYPFFIKTILLYLPITFFSLYAALSYVEFSQRKYPSSFLGGVFEDGKRPIVMDGKHSQNYDCEGAGTLRHHFVVAAERRNPIDEAAGQAGSGIDVLSKEKGHFVDEDVANYAAKGTGDHTHYHCHPHGIVGCKGFLYAYNHKESQTDRVEDEKGTVHAYKDFAEHSYDSEGDTGNSQIEPCLHPEGRDVEEEVAERSAPDGGDESDGIGSEQIEVFISCQTNAAYRKGKGSYHFYYQKECIVQLKFNV